jgi:hypothetical protein
MAVNRWKSVTFACDNPYCAPWLAIAIEPLFTSSAQWKMLNGLSIDKTRLKKTVYWKKNWQLNIVFSDARFAYFWKIGILWNCNWCSFVFHSNCTHL